MLSLNIHLLPSLSLPLYGLHSPSLYLALLHSLCLCLSIILSPTLSLSISQSVSLCPALFHSFWPALSLYLTLSHTLSHSISHSLSLYCTHSLYQPLSLSGLQSQSHVYSNTLSTCTLVVISLIPVCFICFTPSCTHSHLQ